MTFITYMKYDDVAPWIETFNTTVDENDRGESYEEFKSRKAAKFLDEIEIKFPVSEIVFDLFTLLLHFRIAII